MHIRFSRAGQVMQFKALRREASRLPRGNRYIRFSNRHTLQNRVQGAFKDSMIHEILQFTSRIAFRCVLHRCESQEIRCQKLFRFALKAYSRFKVFSIGPVSQPKPQRFCTRGQSQRVNALADTPGRISNDPTAGSPTVTLLRLLVPLNDQV